MISPARIVHATRQAVAAFKRASGGTGFDVAGTSARWLAKYQLAQPISQALAARLPASRKVRWLAENSGLMAAIVSTAVTAIIADGPTVQPTHPDADVNRDLRRRFNAWAQTSDAEGSQSLAGILTQAARGFHIDGESFTKLDVEPNDLRLQLRLLDPEQIDPTLTKPTLGTNTAPFIVAGIEFDSSGRRAAYWVLPAPPSAPWAPTAAAVRVDARDVLHCFEPRTPGAPRGLSPLTAIAPLALELDEAHDAAVVKLKTTALLCMLLENAETLGDWGNDIDTKSTPATLGPLEPGATLRLPPGVKATFPPTSEMQSLAEVLRHMSRLACAGAGVPYCLASGDLADVNYSAGKLGMAAFQRRVRAIQQNNIVAQLLRPIWNRWLLLEILSGRLRADDYESNPENYGANFLFPVPPPLDELKKAKADTLALNARLRSRHELIAEDGRDPNDVDREIDNDPMAPDLTAAAGTIAGAADMESQNA